MFGLRIGKRKEKSEIRSYLLKREITNHAEIVYRIGKNGCSDNAQDQSVPSQNTVEVKPVALGLQLHSKVDSNMIE